MKTLNYLVMGIGVATLSGLLYCGYKSLQPSSNAQGNPSMLETTINYSTASNSTSAQEDSKLYATYGEMIGLSGITCLLFILHNNGKRIDELKRELKRRKEQQRKIDSLYPPRSWRR